ncbi:hypothetical protein A6C57_00090 [Fibrella sp. ES10-3-2-2]|nr:hypothetical protein A6C57_00090 [Fibrella sp. ES10-3-2-2]
MSFYYTPELGTFHLNEVKPPRVVPGNERHKWDRKPAWGESATCTKCGCIKRRKRTQPDYTETYQMPGSGEVSERPACTGA